MAKQDIQSALILSSSVDVELDIKLRLASALGDITDLYDILFVGRQYSEPTEPDAEEVLNFLQQTNKTSDPSAQMQRLWIKRRFLDRKTALYRTSFPEGATAYAVSGRMARRLYHRLRQRMAIDHHDLDYILADVAMLGLSLAYSISPPPVTAYGLDRAISGQFLARSALHSMSLRQDDPSTLPPYNDWKDAWEGLKY
ncbi:hypothetical protein IWW50_002250 [Coemansia erecta]|nr:hypothetical protein IWW50_002250 [Coemansia erecta]